jgi:sugar lactone lactonase YvrE
MVRELTAELLDPARAQVGEGPSWDAEQGCLVWVDITAGLVHRSEADGALRATVDVGRHVGAALPAPGGALLLAVREGFAVLDATGAYHPLLDVYGDRPDLRFNDAKCDPAGRAFAGSMAYAWQQAIGAAALLRLDPGPQASTAISPVTLGNGLGWSPDGRTMYFIDSATQTVSAFGYDPDAGRPLAARQLVTVPPEVGLPDGLCVDGDGGIWVGLWGGSVVHRYTPDGALDTVVRLPVSQVTSCAFGGSDGATLYITTAAYELSAAELAAQPYAGGLFAVRPGTAAPPATPWHPVD